MSYELTCEKRRIDLSKVVTWLKGSYWADRRAAEKSYRAIAGSRCYSVFDGEDMVGFARVVTDGATFAYICDLIVDPDRRGGGIGKFLVKGIVSDPALAGMSCTLATRDAHGLYEQYGFERVEFMKRRL